ncbi:hypothetical protein EW146_g7582 [Bondarzewia mesenterica]|uniref:Uncharacterized protein n=1 Tax=Bondarzewia mesenterica TaxID=1095465 RepID=A0A4S4LKJ2_9AGAM|nr:hypothetical protein EW146_g7582 [Bondarzewia mesenterica]
MIEEDEAAIDTSKLMENNDLISKFDHLELNQGDIEVDPIEESVDPPGAHDGGQGSALKSAFEQASLLPLMDTKSSSAAFMDLYC